METARGDRLILALLVALVAAFSYVVVDTMRVRIIEEGDSAPSFSIKADSGKTITPKDFGGKVLVLNFWATWCQPCVEETPSLVALSNRLASKGLTVVGVSVDTDAKAYQTFINRFGVKFETFRDAESNIPAEYGTFKYPETYIIKDGKVIQKVVGQKNWATPETIAELQKLL
jgi:peroxiredoxin